MFEMLGAFSFGDYFKKDAIIWAWELITKVFGLDRDKLAVSVYREDGEARRIWRDIVGVEERRIVGMGREDNFWAAGEVGPCGPCSEIYYYVGDGEVGGEVVDLEDDECWLELYNLVFMEFGRGEDGVLKELLMRNIDTGMGLERMCRVLQGVRNNFETDLMMPLMRELGRICGVGYEMGEEREKVALKIVADHLRAVVFLIADGVRASNVGRGYVLRRLIRRASRQGRVLGLDETFLVRLLPLVRSMAVDAGYMNVDRNYKLIEKEIAREESKFLQTLDRGEAELMYLIENCKSEENGTSLSGQQVFEMYDRCGFPVELTKEIAEENGVAVNMEGFDEAMERQRRQAREARSAGDHSGQNGTINAEALSELSHSAGSTKFFEATSGSALQSRDERFTALVSGIVVDGAVVDVAKAGDRVALVLDSTPFYAEGGGQVGDSGQITTDDGATVEILDTKLKNGVYTHIGKVLDGELHVGDQITAAIDMRRRRRIMAHHTATHLLQSALKQVLPDENIAQAGSLVDPERLRFDFSCNRPVNDKELTKIEEIINGWITDARATQVSTMNIDTAKEKGAVAMFGEKYGEKVRVINIPDVSMELCGGTHVQNTAEISLFKIVSESGIASGVRRIEAVCGAAAFPYLATRDRVVKDVAMTLNISPEDIPARVVALQEELKTRNKEVAALGTKLAVEKTKKLASEIVSVGGDGVRYLVADVGEMSIDGLKAGIEALSSDVGEEGVVVLLGKNGEKAGIIAMVGKKLQGRLPAGKLVNRIAKKCGGGGGGRAGLAQAGGKAELIGDAVEEAKLLVRAALEE